MFEQIDSLLAATLEVDDYVDIDSLKQTVQHPPFGRDDLKTPLPQSHLEQPPPEPKFVAPPAPTGLSRVFNKQKHADEAARAHAAWVEQHKHVLPAKNSKLLEDHAAAEQKRVEQLAAALAEYKADCAERERSVAVERADLADA